MVFDRGMVSEDNLLAISRQELKFVSALSRDQIPGLHILEPDLALSLTLDNRRRELSLRLGLCLTTKTFCTGNTG